MRKLPKQKIYPFLSGELCRRFKTYCRAKGLTESSVVEAALQEYLDDSKDINLLYRRLDRQNRALGRMERDLNVLSEFMAVFIQVWFAYTPQLPEEEKPAAQRLAMGRYRQFVAHVADAVGNGKRFIDDFVSEPIADDEELKSVLEAAGGQ
ncbi:MAG: hypothetical protein KQH63_04925 [Desulfobulbaceae bacterium]|nr:hypothetical protein [Desulfobulbaceae bacterium]